MSALTTASSRSPAAVGDAAAGEPGKNVSVAHFGARGDGRTDDTAAIQRAIEAVTPTGGSVFFPSGRYLVTATLHVRSRAPLSLVGEMFGAVYDAATGPAILIGKAMASVIRYATPNETERGSSGAGSIRYLSFVDPSTPDNFAPGRRRVGSVLDLRDFAMGLVEGCTFHWIRGCVIRTEMAVMTTVSGCRIRYCGDPDERGNSAIRLDHDSPGFTTQSFLLEDTRIEACYCDPYVSISAQCHDITLRDCRFEAATIEAAGTSGMFIDCPAERYLIDGCGFNRTDAIAVRMAGRGKMTNCHFANALGDQTSLLLDGSRCIVSHCTFEDNRRALSIDCAGYQNQIIGNAFYYSGGVRLSGRGNAFTANQICRTRMAGPGWWLQLAGRALADGNHFDGDIASPSVGGIISTDGDRVTNNSFDRWMGVTCIQRQSGQSFIFGNTFVDVDQSYSETVPDATRRDDRAGARLAANDTVRRVLDFAKDRARAAARAIGKGLQ